MTDVKTIQVVRRADHDKAVDEAKDAGFSAGTIAALAVIAHAGNETTWGEVVRCAGTQKILQHALVNEGDWEWGGFARLAKSTLGAAEVRKARQAVGAHAVA